MIITEPSKLSEYESRNRKWQGIPGIEITSGGRLFASFYSGCDSEDNGNYAVLVSSDDGGVSWSEPVAVVIPDGEGRVYDPCLWVDPIERLWFFVAVAPNQRVVAYVCDNPDSKHLCWRGPVYVGCDVMMNKPIVTANGDWLLPIAVWRDGVKVKYETPHTPKLSFVYRSIDNGASFCALGGADVENRTYDEHMLLERRDGSLFMLVRTAYGIGKAVSDDGGVSWVSKGDSGIGGPNSRFCIRRLKSGNVILINHDNNKSRSGLTAYLSTDDGDTFQYKLLLDERMDVSYPDLAEDAVGNIYVIYDRERGAVTKKMRIPPELAAKEILMTVLTEEDIIAGKFLSGIENNRFTVSKLN